MQRWAILLGVMAASLGAAAPAQAESGRLVDLSLRFTTARANAPTGLAIHAKARGEGKPPALESLVYVFPRGIRIDTGVMPQCSASDAEIAALGPGGCPAESKLTVGKLTAMSGFGPPFDPLTADLHVFNGPEQLVEIITFPGTPVSPAVDRLTIAGNTVTAHPPQAPGGPPDGKMAVKSLDYTIPTRVTSKGSLITTPPTCPRTRRWTSIGTFGFDDGSSDKVATRSSCRPRGGRIKPRRWR